MADYETILVGVDEAGVATVTLNRPDRLNAWTAQMASELSAALGTLDVDDAVRAIVLTGAGRAFCAGADLGGGGQTFAGDRQRRDGAAAPHTVPWMLRKPTIAAINGHAIGVGLTYPLQCDVRYVAEDAKLAFAFVRRGVIPELASHVILARVVGLSNAADLLLSGRTILGGEAAALGLASRALPAAEVLPAAQEWARDVAVNAAPVSVAITKRLLWDGLTDTIETMAGKENPLFAWCGNQPDAKEGISSFLERRPPRWTLRPTADLPAPVRRDG